MIRFRIAVGASLLSLLLAGCSNPHDLKITEENKDNFLESLKDQTGLTVEEMGLLMARRMRASAAEVLGAGGDKAASSIIGKTVGELINEERQIQAAQKAREAEQERLAKEAQAKQEALTAELRKALTFTVFEKTFIPSNTDVGRYRDSIIIKCAYENTSGKDIRAFKGSVEFTDLFGARVFGSGITIQDPLKASAKGTWSGSVDYNQFLPEHIALRNTDLKDMKIVWSPTSIIFGDGTQIGESATPGT